MSPLALAFALAAGLWPAPDPLAAELARWPDAGQAGRGWADADDFRRLALRRAAEAAALGDWVGECQWAAAGAEAGPRATAWHALWQAAQPGGTPALDSWRHRNLAELRRLLGEDDFTLGRMPDPLPWRLFTVVP